MPEMVLPGVYIEVRPEGLIIPGQVTVGNIGIVGTASKGKIGEPILLGSYADARQALGPYDPWIDGTQNELTLVRALELAFSTGATTVFAVRVADTSVDAAGAPTATAAVPANTTLNSAGGANVRLEALSPGTWGNDLKMNVWNAEQVAIVENEQHAGGAAITLSHTPIAKNASNRIRVNNRTLNIGYDDGAGHVDALQTGGVTVKLTDGTLTFPPGEAPSNTDTVYATYAVDKGSAFKVTLRLGRSNDEVYTVVNGSDLVTDINAPLKGSAWVKATGLANAGEALMKSAAIDAFTPFFGGRNGEDAGVSDYEAGLDVLLDQNAHIIIAAGKDEDFGNALDRHCQKASTDAIKHDCVAIVGSKQFSSSVTLDTILGHTLDSDRVVFVTPGIKTTDAAATPPVSVTLPGAYTAAAVAGLLASFPPHISLTNKVLPVDGLETKFDATELTQLLLARVVPIESRQGFHIVRGITTSTNTAWKQITTRRIVDYAKFGVRSAADPYIGLLNNERVRGALRTTINSFLAEMVNDEMLISYDLNVTATRQQEIQGIVQVTMVLRPVFSIDFIKVTMFLG